MNEPDFYALAYDFLNRVEQPGWGDAITTALVAALREQYAAGKELGDKFKEFVHRYLDQHGVPHGDPENHHQKEGCRIGARLDLLFAERGAAIAHCARLRCFSCQVHWTPANDKESCGMAHEETWGHEWVSQRVENLTEKVFEANTKLHSSEARERVLREAFADCEKSLTARGRALGETEDGRIRFDIAASMVQAHFDSALAATEK